MRALALSIVAIILFGTMASVCQAGPARTDSSADRGVIVEWYGHACFEIRAKSGERIVIDPFDPKLFEYVLPKGPVTLAFAIVPASGKAELLIDPAKLDAEAKAHLRALAKLSEPAALGERLKALKDAGKTVRLSPAAPVWFMASIELRIRFKSTCWTWIRSTRTEGRSSGISRCSSICSWRTSIATRSTTSAVSWLTSTGVLRGALLDTNARKR